MKTALLLCFIVWMVCIADAVFWSVVEDTEEYRARRCKRSERESKDCLNGGRCQKRIYNDGRTRLVCLCQVFSFSHGYRGDRCEHRLYVREVN
ncbi:hypothetical protein ACROYT_G036857 [Oculina patagonica]